MSLKSPINKKVRKSILTSVLLSSLILSPILLSTTKNVEKHQNFIEKTSKNPQIINFDLNSNQIFFDSNNNIKIFNTKKIFNQEEIKNSPTVFEPLKIKTDDKNKQKIKPGFLKPGPIQWNYKSQPKKPGYNYLYDKIVHPGRYWNRVTGNPEQIVQNVRIGYWNLVNFEQKQQSVDNLAKIILESQSAIMGLSDQKVSDFDSDQILVKLNSEKEKWEKLNFEDNKNKLDETKKYSIFYKKNELSLTGKHLKKGDSNPFLVSDQEINGTFPIAVGFKAVNNNKEFLVIMGNFMKNSDNSQQNSKITEEEKITEKPQEENSETEEKTISKKVEKQKEKTNYIESPVYFNDSDNDHQNFDIKSLNFFYKKSNFNQSLEQKIPNFKDLTTQRSKVKSEKQLNEIIDEFKNKSGINEVIFLTSRSENEKLGKGLGGSEYNSLISKVNSKVNGMLTSTKNMVKTVADKQINLGFPMLIDVQTGLYSEDEISLTSDEVALKKLKKLPKDEWDEIRTENKGEDKKLDNSQVETEPEISPVPENDSENKSETDHKNPLKKPEVEQPQSQNIPPIIEETEPKKNEEESKEKVVPPPTPENSEKTEKSNLVRFGFWNIDKFTFGSKTNKKSENDLSENSSLNLISEVIKKMDSTIVGLVIKDGSTKQNVESAAGAIVKKLDEIKNNLENNGSSQTLSQPVSDVETIEQTNSTTRWKYKLYEENETANSATQVDENLADESDENQENSASGTKRSSRRSTRKSYNSSRSSTGKQKEKKWSSKRAFLFLFDSSIWELISDGQTTKNNPFIVANESIENTNRKWVNKPVGIKLKLKGQNNDEKKINFVLGSFDSDGNQNEKNHYDDFDSSSGQSSKSKRKRGRGRSNSNSEVDLNSESSNSVSSSAETSPKSQKIDLSKFPSQGEQEITEAHGLKSVLEKVKSESKIENILFAGTTNIKEKSFANAFDDLLKSYSQLLTTKNPTKIHKNKGYVDPMNSVFYDGKWKPNLAERVDWLNLENYTKGSDFGPKEEGSLKKAFDEFSESSGSTRGNRKTSESNSKNWSVVEKISNHAPVTVQIDFEKNFNNKEELKKQVEENEKLTTESDMSVLT